MNSTREQCLLYLLTEINSINKYKDATGRVRYSAALRHAAGAGSLTKLANDFVNEYKKNLPLLKSGGKYACRGRFPGGQKVAEDPGDGIGALRLPEGQDINIFVFSF